MLTPRENFLEYLKPDGKPEYLNNSFQMFRFLMGDPCSKFVRGGRVRGVDSVDPWGTFIHFGADEPAAYAAPCRGGDQPPAYALGARKIPATSRRRRQMVPQQKRRANPAPRVTTSL